MKTKCLMLFALTLAACHSSCDEASGAAPVVVPDAASAVPAMQPINKRMMQRPNLHPVAPADQD